MYETFNVCRLLNIYNQSITQSYGSTGQETVNKMAAALGCNGLSLKYESTTKKFTVPSTTGPLSSERIDEIFSKLDCENWQPHILNETDKFGNLQIELIAVSKVSIFDPFKESFSIPLNEARVLLRAAFENKNSQTGYGFSVGTREAHAAELVSNIVINLKVPIKGKVCIDVGCGSGENTLAMQNAGAKVIGIDPVDTEFTTAKNIGLKVRISFSKPLCNRFSPLINLILQLSFYGISQLSSEPPSLNL